MPDPIDRSDDYISRLAEAEIAQSNAAHEERLSQLEEPEPDPLSHLTPWLVGGTISLAVLLGIISVIAEMMA